MICKSFKSANAYFVGQTGEALIERLALRPAFFCHPAHLTSVLSSQNKLTASKKKQDEDKQERGLGERQKRGGRGRRLGSEAKANSPAYRSQECDPGRKGNRTQRNEDSNRTGRAGQTETRSSNKQDKQDIQELVERFCSSFLFALPGSAAQSCLSCSVLLLIPVCPASSWWFAPLLRLCSAPVGIACPTCFFLIPASRSAFPSRV